MRLVLPTYLAFIFCLSISFALQVTITADFNNTKNVARLGTLDWYIEPTNGNKTINVTGYCLEEAASEITIPQKQSNGQPGTVRKTCTITDKELLKRYYSFYTYATFSYMQPETIDGSPKIVYYTFPTPKSREFKFDNFIENVLGGSKDIWELIIGTKKCDKDPSVCSVGDFCYLTDEATIKYNTLDSMKTYLHRYPSRFKDYIIQSDQLEKGCFPTASKEVFEKLWTQSIDEGSCVGLHKCGAVCGYEGCDRDATCITCDKSSRCEARDDGTGYLCVEDEQCLQPSVYLDVCSGDPEKSGECDESIDADGVVWAKVYRPYPYDDCSVGAECTKCRIQWGDAKSDEFELTPLQTEYKPFGDYPEDYISHSYEYLHFSSLGKDYDNSEWDYEVMVECECDGVKVTDYDYIKLRLEPKPLSYSEKSGDCYSASYKISAPLKFYVNPENDDGLSDEYVIEKLRAAMDVWQKETQTNLFDEIVIDRDAHAEMGLDSSTAISYVGKSIISFESAPVTYYTLAQAAKTNVLPLLKPYIEYCHISLVKEATFGDGQTGLLRIMGPADLQATLTHELGHCLGLDDRYIGCQDSMMSFTVGYPKRTLADSDKEGLRALYGGTDEENS